MLTMLDRAQGCLLGLAVGDAVGTTLEFHPRGSFTPITDMVGGGPFHLKAGQWTDDTSMALCIAASLIETQRMDLRDQMDRYIRWWREGYMSSTGRCFDIGTATASALRRYATTGNPLAGSDNPNSAGNGCLMRLAPVPIRYAHHAGLAVETSEASARTTHAAAECVQATRIFGEMLTRALNGYSKAQITCDPEHTSGVSPKLNAVVFGRSYQKKPRNAIRGSGYVVEALEAALWAFCSTDNFRDCVLAAANLGDDADTTAAIAGQLAGAHYGLGGIPPEWVERTYDAGTIVKMAAELAAMSAADAKAESEAAGEAP